MSVGISLQCYHLRNFRLKLLKFECGKTMSNAGMPRLSLRPKVLITFCEVHFHLATRDVSSRRNNFRLSVLLSFFL